MRLCFVFFWFLATFPTAFAFQGQKVSVSKIMQQHASEFLENSIARAVSIAIYQKGQSYTSHHGELDQNMINPPTDATIYEIASVTKTFTGLLAAKAILDGKLSLDADIRSYLEGNFPNLAKEGEPVRVRHLITHTSGFPAEHPFLERIATQPADGLLWQQRFINEKLYSKKQFIQDLAHLKLKSIPGKAFLYSNYSTNMTAYLIERVYGEPFEQLVKAHILDVAGMKQTRMNVVGTDQFHLANGYNEQGFLMPNLPLGYTLWGAEGALKSTAPDMIKYMRYVLRKDNALIQEAQKRLFKLDDGYWVGYFWWIINLKNRLNHQDGIKTLRHDGGAIGTRNVFRVYPEDDIGIWVVTNITGPNIFNDLTKLSYDLFEAIHQKMP